MGERRGWKNGERWEKGGKKMRETGDKGKKEDKGERGWEKRVEGERKEKRSGRRLLLSSSKIQGQFFVFLESQMHISRHTPVI